MEMEKRRSKGSFLSLFDWNSKSRKKLIWNDPEVSKQGKENVENLPKSQLTRIKVDEIGASPSNIPSCDFDSTLSICSDEGYGSKAPGLVARLMGLDSLPAAAVAEISCTSLYGSKSNGASHCNEGALHSVDDFRPADYINTPLKLEKTCLDAVESRARKVENLPIKRFQTEVLPPRSAKPIPVTHNKLLSPIKSPGFLPPKNAAHVMEAAAKIIEASPRPYLRNRTASTGPSSVPLRILNLKERLEAAQYASLPGKPVDLSSAYPANGKLSERSSNLYKCTSAFKGSRGSEKNSSCHLASKGKSISLAIQGKNNAQSRDTLISNGNRKCMKQKEKNEIKSKQLSRSQKPNTQQALQQRPCSSRNSSVLGQNNQKQNNMTTKGKSTTKIDSNKPTTRASSSETSTGIRKTKNKGAITANIQPKRSSNRATDNQKEFLRSKTEIISQKKKYISRDVHEARDPDNAVNNFGSKSIKCNFTTDGSFDQDAFNMKESKDVISFTFTSPLRRNMPESSSSTEQVMGTRNRIDVNSHGHSDNLCPKNLSLSPPGLHMIDSDALSVLLDKKLQELTSRINLPQCTLATEGSSTGLRSTVQDKVPSVASTTPKEQDKSFCPDFCSDKLDSMHNSHCCSSDDPVLNMNQQLQTSEVSEDRSCSSNSESGNDLVCWHSTAVAGFKTPFVSESYLDSEDSAYGSTVYSSTQDEEVSNFSQINESVSLENEVKGSEQSSSTFWGRNMTVKQTSGISNLVDFERSSNMELEYVQDILGNAEFMAEEFVMGQTSTVIMPNLFDLLENRNYGTENYGEEHTKLERKVIFDCVSEFLELRCEQAFIGTCKAWPGWAMSVQRKSWMAEEMYQEMLGFRSMEEVMVDELVDKDMSSGCGKWLDFDVEAFEEGLEVEGDILAYLINELVSDLLLV
ncbi:dentin sialophosphoprotein [Spatholobus suberectus]|nr:dentin sialophosphoprotein [Spatholobus suberectus]